LVHQIEFAKGVRACLGKTALYTYRLERNEELGVSLWMPNMDFFWVEMKLVTAFSKVENACSSLLLKSVTALSSGSYGQLLERLGACQGGSQAPSESVTL
jgi:hypothetical protein